MATQSIIERDLSETKIGFLWIEFERKTTRAFTEDGKLREEDAPSAKKLSYVRNLWNEADTAREAFLAALHTIYEARVQPDGSYWGDVVCHAVKSLFTPASDEAQRYSLREALR